MITEQDLQEAIAECNGKRNPDANTCIKLAAFLTIHREMFGGQNVEQPYHPSYSYAPAPEEEISYSGDSEFSREIYGMNTSDVMKVMDELMTTLQIVNPRLYAGVMRELRS